MRYLLFRKLMKPIESIKLDQGGQMDILTSEARNSGLLRTCILKCIIYFLSLSLNLATWCHKLGERIRISFHIDLDC